MMTIPMPANEARRIDALRRYGILDTLPEREFDDLAVLASHVCGTPIALICLIDANRQWFKAKVGLDLAETPRDISFCAHAILRSDLLVVPDALADDRFAANPLVTGAPHIRFYAGAPLFTPDGHAPGTLCVIDRVPRRLTAQQADALRALSRQVVGQLEMRRTSAARARDAADSLRAEELMRAITQGTSPVTGAAFFRAFVQHLAAALRVRYAFVAECLPNMRARTRAFWNGDDFGEDFEYALPGTPCMEVAKGRTCHCPERLPEVFPEDRAMIEMGTQSYLGVPLLDSSRRIIGHVVIFDTKPMPADPLTLSVMETFAGRAGAELERAHAYEQLQALGQELKTLLDVNVAVARHLERDELFGALASCLRNLLETDFFGIELPIEGNKLQGHLLTPRGARVEPTQPTVLPAEGTACDWVIRNRLWFVSSTRDELRERFPVTFDVMRQERMESLCALPLAAGDRCLGALFFMAVRKATYERLRRGLLDQVAGAVAVALDDCLAHEEVRRLRDRFAAENTYLKEEIRAEHNFVEIIGNSPKLRAVLMLVEQVAPTDSTVLIYGETGTGKELLARAIHDRSARKERPLITVNCGAISAGLVESELFGHVKGAFTGALASRDGRFKAAYGGTIFLDEVGELPLETQVKLLRVLQDQEFEPIGSDKTVRVDVRIIAATNRNLEDAVRAGKFRSDLFYRLNVFPIQVPPLRERRSDVPPLVTFFLQEFSKKLGNKVTQVSGETMQRLANYAWPGNIRELQNVIERAVILSSGNVLVLDGEFQPATPSTVTAAYESLAPPRFAPSPSAAASLEEVERRHIESVLSQTAWVIEGDRGAAKILNLHPNTLRSRMKKLGIQRPLAQAYRAGDR